ncbi:MAG: hypothetical protein Q9227_001173 [Pyrenula ochraceoflavens]
MPRADYRNCNAVSPECPVGATTYGYYPNLPASIVYITVFGLCCLLQLCLGTRYKTYPYMIGAAIGTFGEAIGYGGRVMMHKNPWSSDGFKIQICCLVLAPSFLAASVYLTLKWVVRHCGEQYSRLKPTTYTWAFISGDFGSIVLQAIGGGVAAAGGHEHPDVANTGDHIILAGIGFQIFTMIVCAAVVGEYYWRLKSNRPVRAKDASSGPPSGSDEPSPEDPEKHGDEANATVKSERLSVDPKKFRVFLWAVGFAFLTIFIRCVYRMPEMSGGWGGPVMRKENEFYVLDGM